MAEADRIAKATQGPVTTSRLVADLRGLGVVPGQTLLVHCAMGALGWICGGSQAVIEALHEAVGAQGTLAMPAHANDRSEPANWGDPAVPESWWPIIRAEMPAFDPATTPTRGMGQVAECFRSAPGALRSGHPQVSMAACGRYAPDIVAHHDLPDGFGEASPLRALYDLDARIVLLGVGYDCCTALHLAEHRAPHYRPGYKPSGAAICRDGQRVWHDYAGFAYDPDDFMALGADYDAAGRPLARSRVGEAEARLLSMVDLVDFATGWIGSRRGTQPTG
ncbi:AAC(3) family N-acetyltransferase [Salinisphaera sp. SPP-AMP-43]|uniref:aminoglycoside N(3)-acetyltransferase n=1 Tax=Salinisphaera sp. SPP-AMP-43 TaxID=3121288 RepID=UPI003C6E8BA1